MMSLCSRVLGLLLCGLLVCDAKTRVKVFERGNRNKWPQAIVIGPDWAGFVAKTRQRLNLPANAYLGPRAPSELPDCLTQLPRPQVLRFRGFRDAEP